MGAPGAMLWDSAQLEDLRPLPFSAAACSLAVPGPEAGPAASLLKGLGSGLVLAYNSDGDYTHVPRISFGKIGVMSLLLLREGSDDLCLGVTVRHSPHVKEVPKTCGKMPSLYLALMNQLAQVTVCNWWKLGEAVLPAASASCHLFRQTVVCHDRHHYMCNMENHHCR